MTEYRQGGMVFSHPYASRRLQVTDKYGTKLTVLDVGNPFDSRPASLDEIQDAIDDFCQQRSRPGHIGHGALDTT